MYLVWKERNPVKPIDRCISLLTVLAVTIIVLVASVPSATRAQTTWIVDDDGPADFSTIQDAVDAASAGDTIVVYPGNYTENVDVNKDHLTIQSESGEEATIVQVALVHPDTPVFEITDDYVTVRGFTVKGAGSSFGTGISLSHADHCTINDNYISNNGDGILIHESNDVAIINNKIEFNKDRGIEAWYLNDSTMLENNVKSNEFMGIHLIYSTNKI